MKRNYTSPAIETTEILVEQGIAFSNAYINNAAETFGWGDNVTFSNADANDTVIW